MTEKQKNDFRKKSIHVDDDDHSLRAAALKRVLDDDRPPRTATPWEWEAWYEAHPSQVPHSNTATDSHERKKQNNSLIARIKRLFSRKEIEKKSSANCVRHPDEDSEF